jgi:uncharacterized protein (TIGR00369 family)
MMNDSAKTCLPFSDVTVNRHFGFELVSRTGEEATVSMTRLEEFVQEYGVVHGGVVSTLADTAAVYVFHPDLGAGRGMTSIEYKLNFLRPVLPDRGVLTARARVVQRGKRVGLCDVDVYQSNQLVAKGLFTYMFYERQG